MKCQKKQKLDIFHLWSRWGRFASRIKIWPDDGLLAQTGDRDSQLSKAAGKEHVCSMCQWARMGVCTATEKFKRGISVFTACLLSFLSASAKEYLIKGWKRACGFVFLNWLSQSIITAYYPNSGCTRGEPGALSSIGNDGSAGSAGCAGCVTSSGHKWVGLFLQILTRHQESSWTVKHVPPCCWVSMNLQNH